MEEWESVGNGKEERGKEWMRKKDGGKGTEEVGKKLMRKKDGRGL